MLLTILGVLLGVILGIIILLLGVVLWANWRIKQLAEEKYSYKERFAFISWLVSWAVPLFLNVKVEVEGIEYVDAVETGVIYGNHQSLFDIVALVKGIKRPHGYIAKKELDNIFFLSNAMRLIRCQFMDRNDVRQSVKVISNAAKTVKEGHLMVIFPEGTRKVRGEMGLFKAGSFKLAQKAKADIIPVTIYNSYEVMKRWPRRTVMKVTFHAPIPYEQYEALSSNEIAHQVETIVKTSLN